MAAAGTKKKVLFDDTEDESDGGADLQINDAYAKRFEHNKKREELHRLEEKYKSNQTNGNKSRGNNNEDDEEGSSSDETEDDEGFLATEELDAQISATLQALKNKDPRLYDGKTTFYTPIDADAAVQSPDSIPKKEKPVFLQDYHRERLMRGETGADEDGQGAPPQTYTQEQDELKKSLQNEIQAQLRAAGDDESSDEEEGFVKPKEEKTKANTGSHIHPSRAAKVKVPDVKEADKDPELFLSNYLSSRAWAQGGDNNGWLPFDSDEEEVEKADEWEAAYNLRFEDPNKSNEVLKSYARDVTAAISVRREDKTGRKRQRELEKERKEAEKQQKKEERARLKRLKLEEADEKLKKIKKAAGIRGKVLNDEEWQKLLESSWENDQWEEEMNKFFNDQYYAEGEGGSDDEVDDDDEDAAGASKKKKVKKPKWDDDIDIKDLVPDFEDEEKPKFTLTDDETPTQAAEEDEAEEEEDDDEEEGGRAAKRQKTTKERKKEKLQSQKEARKERARLEALVEARMNLEDPEILSGGPSSSSSSKKKNAGPAPFGYIETKPETFGLTTRDILMASDADLNEFAGLKKLAHWRDPEKQSKDRKRLGKKARLRQWRKETFGPEFEREPPALNFGEPELKKEKNDNDNDNVIEGGSKKKRKRSRPKKEGKGKEVESAA
ncbi:Krr1-domain-containing protein [Poronia punctata]|nr:Krr1-domain-containing protein [Poronia punctata]